MNNKFPMDPSRPLWFPRSYPLMGGLTQTSTKVIFIQNTKHGWTYMPRIDLTYAPISGWE